jgi:hypothetical protein
MYGDATRVNTDLAKLQAVTTGEIKQVINKYIAGKPKVVLEYLPEAMNKGPRRPAPPAPPQKKEKKP